MIAKSIHKILDARLQKICARKEKLAGMMTRLSNAYLKVCEEQTNLLDTKRQLTAKPDTSVVDVGSHDDEADARDDDFEVLNRDYGGEAGSA